MPSPYSHFPACRSTFARSRASRSRRVLDSFQFLAGLALFASMLVAGGLASIYFYP